VIGVGGFAFDAVELDVCVNGHGVNLLLGLKNEGELRMDG
jgi:hypothetical protein